ncbi:MAG: GNAT family N-acetyltransferase [Alphaproteobacteria bacterium]|nr:GNAT family N-acetyltransferase [Alphaproteobacteria bacterium]
MEIRHAEETDLVSLMALFQISVETQGAEHYSSEQVHAWASRATEATFGDFILIPTTFVAIDDSGPMGFCGYARDGHITSLYIRPDCAGQGIGKKLLTHVLEDARAHDVTDFHVEASAMAIPLFEKLGFEKSGLEDYLIGDSKFERQLMKLKGGVP